MGLPMEKRYDSIYCFFTNTDMKQQNEKQGFRSELILNVYGIHLRKVAGSLADWGKHIGALALCMAVVSSLIFTLFIHSDCDPLYQTEHALSFWASGEDLSMKTDKNGKPKLVALFSDLEWGPKACGWSQATSRLTAEQWRQITAEATICGNMLPQDEASGDNIPDVDP